MVKVVIALLTLLILPTASMAMGPPPKWQAEVISLISHQKFDEAGEKLKEYCVKENNAELCLTLASAYFEGEARLGIESKDIIEAYKYTRLACDNGSEAGCNAYKAAIDKGELLQYVLFEPGVKNRDKQLKEALKLGSDLNATTMFSRTILQEAIGEEKIEVIELLLKNGIDVNYRVSEEDLTPLMYAINTGNKEIVNLLLKSGVDTTQVMKVPQYLNLGKKEANACDIANKLEKREMIALLKCTDTTADNR